MLLQNKKYRTFAIALALCFSSIFANISNSFAAKQEHSKDNDKIGLIDMQIVEAKADVISDLSNKLQEEQNKLRNSITNKSKRLQGKARDLEAKKGILSVSAIEEKRKSLENELISLQGEAQIKNDNIQAARNDILMEVDLEVRNITKKISKSKGLQIVIPRQAALYISDDIAYDITDLVLKELNSSFKTVDFAKHLNNINSKGKK